MSDTTFVWDSVWHAVESILMLLAAWNLKILVSIRDMVRAHEQTLYGVNGANGLLSDQKETVRIRNERVLQLERLEVRVGDLEREAAATRKSA